ncbi:MAG: hypothetical protein HWN81_15850 [Candidatus Lokiarchaeota archaeon]|nr:hypothetical protein [Candidatus Lokiarchaeota archaeon]
MKTLNTSERGLIASLIISDLVSFLLILYNFLFAVPGERYMIPIFLIVMPAVYLETKRKLEMEQNKSFQYKKVLWVLMSCLIITESMNLILSLL